MGIRKVQSAVGSGDNHKKATVEELTEKAAQKQNQKEMGLRRTESWLRSLPDRRSSGRVSMEGLHGAQGTARDLRERELWALGSAAVMLWEEQGQLRWNSLRSVCALACTFSEVGSPCTLGVGEWNNPYRQKGYLDLSCWDSPRGSYQKDREAS